MADVLDCCFAYVLSYAIVFAMLSYFTLNLQSVGPEIQFGLFKLMPVHRCPELARSQRGRSQIDDQAVVNEGANPIFGYSKKR